MAILTRDLCNEYGNIPLSPLGIKICLSAVKVLVAALKGTDSEEEGVVESNDKRNVMTKVAGTGVAERGRGRESKENDNNRDKDESKGFGSEDSGQKGERDEEKGEEEGEGDEEGESDEDSTPARSGIKIGIKSSNFKIVPLLGFINGCEMAFT